MMNEPFDTPVLFLIFNRPDHTRRSFEAIRARQPTRLFIAADGPRSHVPTDPERVAQCRAIVSGVDWPCEVRTLYRQENLGCRAAVSQAITWFFDQVEQGIILEDDCVPEPDFWTFCATLLDRYAQDPRVMCVSGNNFLPSWMPVRGAYYFSRYPYIWGWASWARAWEAYGATPDHLSRAEVIKSLNNVSMYNPLSRWWWRRTFKKYIHPSASAWGYQWTFAIWTRRGLSATPHRNLVTNIGVGVEGTHTVDAMHVPAGRPLDPRRPLSEQPAVQRYRLADAVYDLGITTCRNVILHGVSRVMHIRRHGRR